ncbi:MAG: transposase [Gammaproteobacteria bacterium]
MAPRLKTGEGRALYAPHKQSVEPVFGIVKSAIGFRQFCCADSIMPEVNGVLMTLGWNIKRMFALQST